MTENPEVKRLFSEMMASVVENMKPTGTKPVPEGIKRTAQKFYTDGVSKGYDDGMVLDVVALLEQAILAERKRISGIVMNAWIAYDENATMLPDDLVKRIFRDMEDE